MARSDGQDVDDRASAALQDERSPRAFAKPDAIRASLLRSTLARFALAQLAASAVIATVIAIVLATELNDVLTRHTVDLLRSEAYALTELHRTGGPQALREAVGKRNQLDDRRLVLALDLDGRRLAGNLNRWPPELAADDAGGLFRYETLAPGTGEGLAGGSRLAAGLQTRLQDGSRLLVAHDLETERASLAKLRMLLLGGLGGLTIVGLATAALLGRSVLRQVGGMTETADRVMAGDLGHRIVPAGSGDELDELALRLNAMLDRIERLVTGMREISDNIAHDLRTPLNRLRNRAEAALREGAADPQAHRRALEATIEQADEIIQTFNALLLIARLEAGAGDATAEPFDLAGLARDVADLYGPLAEEARVPLVVEMPERLMVRANRRLVSQAVANLIDNAIKYGRPVGREGVIEVRVREEQATVAIEVGDRGPGIPAEWRDRVLERFVRLDASRTRPGTGLGLSLVAAVARLHGGRVELGDNHPGLKVRLVLPLERSQGSPPSKSRPQRLTNPRPSL